MSAQAEASVQAVANAGGGETPAVMAAVEGRMVELAGQHGDQLGRYAAATIAAGGKRLRPLLVCVSSGVPVVRSEQLVRAAVAVELIHAATLVHDDVLDDAALRRGRPTVYASGGRLMATATGDLLLSRAFHELAAGGVLAPVQVLSRAAAELAAGELMQRGDGWDMSLSLERYLERCRLKTGVLFRASCELGALSGDGPVEPLARFGESVGIAFQLLDDVLDVSGPPERTGKPRGTDLLDGTVTLPLIEAMRRDRELAELDLRSVRTTEQAAAVCDAIVETGALGVVRTRALEWVAGAKAVLPASLGEAQRVTLELVADGVVERYS
jgi:geranylgeranyl pyrophosphate synthase